MTFTFNVTHVATPVTLEPSATVADLMRHLPRLCTAVVNHIVIDPCKHARVMGAPLSALDLDPNGTYAVHVVSPTVQVFVKHAGCTRTMDVSLDWPVESVKLCIAALVGAGPRFYRYHRLHYGGKDLTRGDATLRDYGVQRESTLFTIGRLVGGGKRTREQELMSTVASLRAEIAALKAQLVPQLPSAKRPRVRKGKGDTYNFPTLLSVGHAVLHSLKGHGVTFLRSMALRRRYEHSTDNAVRVHKSSLTVVAKHTALLSQLRDAIDAADRNNPDWVVAAMRQEDLGEALRACEGQSPADIMALMVLHNELIEFLAPFYCGAFPLNNDGRGFDIQPCDACGDTGGTHWIECDGCGKRDCHVGCAHPGRRADDLGDDDTWHCKACGGTTAAVKGCAREPWAAEDDVLVHGLFELVAIEPARGRNMFGIARFPTLGEQTEPLAYVDQAYLQRAHERRECFRSRGWIRPCVSKPRSKHPREMYHDSCKAHLPGSLRLSKDTREVAWLAATLHHLSLTDDFNPTLKADDAGRLSVPVVFSDADANAQRFVCENEQGNCNWWWSGPLWQSLLDLGCYHAGQMRAFVGLLRRLMSDDADVDRFIAKWMDDKLPFPPIGLRRHGQPHYVPQRMHAAALETLRTSKYDEEAEELEPLSCAPLADSEGCSVRQWEERLTRCAGDGVVVRFTREPTGTEIADGVRLVTAGAQLAPAVLDTCLDESSSDSDSESDSESDSCSDSQDGSDYEEEEEEEDDDVVSRFPVTSEAEDVQRAIENPSIGTYAVLVVLGKIQDARVDALLRVRLGEKDAAAWKDVANRLATRPYMFSSAVATWVAYGRLMTRALCVVVGAARQWFPTPTARAVSLPHVLRWAVIGGDADWSQHAPVIAAANEQKRAVVVLGGGSGAGLQAASDLFVFETEFQRIAAICCNAPHAVVLPFSWHGACCTGIDRATTVIFDADRVEASAGTCSCQPENGLPRLCDMYEHEMWSPCQVTAGPFTCPDHDATLNGLLRYTVPLES